jgi:hypothetical protein
MIKKINFFAGILLIFVLNMNSWAIFEDEDFFFMKAGTKDLGSWNKSKIVNYYIDKKKVLDELNLKFYNELQHKIAELKYKLQEQKYNLKSWKLANDKFLEVCRIPALFSLIAFGIGFMIMLYKQDQERIDAMKNK